MTETTFVKDESEKKLTLTREFGASVEQVWKAFTDHRVLDRWWAPPPWKCKTKTQDFKVGGTWLFSMSKESAESSEPVFAGFDFKKIEPQKSYSGQDYFCDSKGENRHHFGLWNYLFTPSSIGTHVQIEIIFESVEELNKSGEMQNSIKETHQTLDEIFRLWNKPTFVKDEAKKRLVVTREFNGTLDQVWYAYTHAKILSQWWAPKPWKAVTLTQDFREGGIWHFAMKDPSSEAGQHSGKTDYHPGAKAGQHWGKTDYLKIIPFQLVESREGFSDEKAESQARAKVCRIEFFKVSDEVTRVGMEKIFDTAEDLQKDLDMGFKEGMAMAMGGLDELLKKPKALVVKTKTLFIVDEEQKQLTVSRTFSAPLDRVWKAWTDHQIIDRWWAPLPFITNTKEYDFKDGGLWFYSMTHNSSAFHMKTVFTKIVNQELIEEEDCFCDEKGEKPELPTYTKTTFSAIGDGETKVEIETTFKTVEDLNKLTLDQNCYGGWATAQQQLDELLAKGEDLSSSSAAKKGGTKRKSRESSSEGSSKRVKGGD